MSKSNWKKFGCIVAGVVSGSAAMAQGGWFFECIDLNNMMPYSTDYGTIGTGNELMVASLGVSGTVTYGGTAGPCYGPTARTLNAAGRLGFQVGPVGSVQSDFDDGLALTVGMPNDPVGDYCYALIETDAGRALFGNGGLNGAFVGASNRYFVGIWGDANTQVVLRVRVLGEAARLEWNITNLTEAVNNIGLRFGAYVGMITGQGQVDPGVPGGVNQANSLLGTNFSTPKLTPENYIGFTVLPTSKPVRNERNYFNTSPNFPKTADFYFGQTASYGTHLDNEPPESTRDATRVRQFLIGNHGNFTSPGLLWNNVMRDTVFLGTPTQEEADIFLNETCFIQAFELQPVAAGATRRIVHYWRSPWAVSDYNDPYTAIADAPKLVATDIANGVNELTPNPMTIRAYVDNQYATLDREVTLQDVRITLTLPPSMRRVADQNGVVKPASQTIPVIAPNAIAFVEWTVEADGEAFGYQPYSIKFEPVPGPVKTLNGTILVAATPRLRLPDGAVLVTFPWNFPDSSLDAVLGLQAGVDYVAYQWDPDQNGYVPATSAQRGKGVWIITKADLGFHPLQQPSNPPDIARGGLLVNLRNGWNLIGNPYNYAVPLSQLVAVAEDTPGEAITWQQLLALGYVQASLAYYDEESGNYLYTQGNDALLQPNTGYWLYVSTFRPIRLTWPAVFIPGLPDAGRGRNAPAPAPSSFAQTEKSWRLQLSARNGEGQDSQNFVGVVTGTRAAQSLKVIEPPAAPDSKVSLAIHDVVNGKPTRMAQSMTDKVTRKEWKLFVSSEIPGEVTVTWPNITTVPKNVQFRIVDPGGSVSRDLRSTSGYTVRFDKPGSRELRLQMVPGGAVRAIIGNVVVSRPSRAPNSPFTINYSLSADAMTSIRILAGSGKEVYTITRGRADASGQNSATWPLRDNANRAVAPGTYTVEILAETVNGDRVRKIVPITVIR